MIMFGQFLLLHQVVGSYGEELKENQARRLRKQGVDQSTIVHFNIGCCRGSWAEIIPKRDFDLEGSVLLTQELRQLGLLLPPKPGSIHLQERFEGCITVPIFDETGSIVEIYGRRFEKKPYQRTHEYLKLINHQNFFNFKYNNKYHHREIILTESVFDALALWSHGFKNVTATLCKKHMIDNIIAFIKKRQPKKVYLAFKNTKRGNAGISEIARRLSEIRVACFQLELKKNQSIKDVLAKSPDPRKAVSSLLKNSTWLLRVPAQAA